jgi:amidase
MDRLSGAYYFSILFAAYSILTSCRPEDPPAHRSGFILEGISVEELQDKLGAGEFTSVQITQLYLDRIREIDQSGPELRAVIEINPDALAIAAELDMERLNYKVRGPLHGIPILIKDNIETSDRMQTTAGSLAMVGNRAKEDAFIIRQLRDAGAIILGKTNMTEWSNFRSVNAVSGWSSRGGQTKNPYVLTTSPCGSSTGSAVAVAADLCVVAVGTSTDGSIA